MAESLSQSEIRERVAGVCDHASEHLLNFLESNYKGVGPEVSMAVMREFMSAAVLGILTSALVLSEPDKEIANMQALLRGIHAKVDCLFEDVMTHAYTEHFSSQLEDVGNG